MGYGYGSHWGMMGWGNGGFWPIGMIIWIVIIVAIITLISWAVRGFSSSSRYESPRRSSGLDTLEERYARGEINRDEYLQKKNDLQRG
jgi:putative membrane protein